MKRKKIFRLFQNLRIGHKLLLSYFLITLIPVISVGYISGSYSARASREQSLNLIRQLQQNTISSINKQLDNYKFLANTIYDNQKIQQLVSGRYIDYYDEYDIANSLLQPVLQALLNATGKGIYVALIRYNNDKSEIIPYNFENINELNEKVDLLNGKKQIYNVLNLDRMEKKAWFHEVRGKLDQYTWQQIGEDKKHQYISLLREMRDYDTLQNTKIGLLRLTVRLADILGEENFSELSGKGVSLVFDGNRNLLSTEKEKEEYYTLNKSVIDKFLGKQGNKDNIILKDKILVRSKISSVDWDIISVFPITQITENTNRIRDIGILVCVISLLVLFIITFLLSNSFSKRVVDLAERMQGFKEDMADNAEKKSLTGDEMTFLTLSFENMTDRIDTLIQDNFQANLDKKDAQLKALQAQINPHFLYNSMSAICRLAEFGAMEDIITMVKALSKYYRMTLNKGKDIISISDELEQVKAYLEVYRIRKGEDFEASYDIEEEVLGYYTVKVILQPFVENIFEHAVGVVRHPIHIVIRAMQNTDTIIFHITDDGPGIEPDRLETLLREDKAHTSSGYGIRNVDERIKLQFGDEYGVHILSEPGEGVSVEIILPKYKI